MTWIKRGVVFTMVDTIASDGQETSNVRRHRCVGHAVEARRADSGVYQLIAASIDQS